MELGSLTSIFQLACAYTLLLGGHSTFRSKKEEDAEEMLDRAYSQLRTMILRANPPLPTAEEDRKIEQFEYIEWKKTSLRKLNKHRSYATEWYYKEKDRRRFRDSIRSSVLYSVGIVALCLLFVSSFFSNAEIPKSLGWGLALMLWIPPLIIMSWIWLEDFQLGRQIYAEPSHKRRREKGPVPPPSDKPHPRTIYAITNHINRLHRVFEEKNVNDGNVQ